MALRSARAAEPTAEFGFDDASNDASFLEAGVPTLVWGPGRPGLAHAVNKRADVSQIITAAKSISGSRPDLDAGLTPRGTVQVASSTHFPGGDGRGGIEPGTWGTKVPTPASRCPNRHGTGVTWVSLGLAKTRLDIVSVSPLRRRPRPHCSRSSEICRDRRWELKIAVSPVRSWPSPFAKSPDINWPAQRTRPRAATSNTVSTTPPRAPQITSCRFTQAHTWLGTTARRSPTRRPAAPAASST